LRGIVVHSGYADGGHYYSYSQDRESDKWFEFNDTYVSEFKESEIPDECFGGEEKWGSLMNFKNHVKSRNAYVVFYERISDFEPINSDDEAEKEKDVEMEVETIKIPKEIDDIIQINNQEYWQSKFLFSKEYIQSTNELLMFWNTSNIIPYTKTTRNEDLHIYNINPETVKRRLNAFEPPQDFFIPAESINLSKLETPQRIKEFEIRVFKFTAIVYLTVIQRMSEKHQNIPNFMDLLKSQIN